MEQAFTRIFTGTEDFEAMYKAEAFLRDRGFSVGSSQIGAPRGILFGNYKIAKWSNMDQNERQQLDGRMSGQMRPGPVTIMIRKAASAEALAAIAKAEADNA